MNKIDPQIERVLTEREVLMRLDNEDHQRPMPHQRKNIWDQRHKKAGMISLRENKNFSSRGDAKQELLSFNKGWILMEIILSLR